MMQLSPLMLTSVMVMMMVMMTIAIDGEHRSGGVQLFNVRQGVGGQLTERAEGVGPLGGGTPTFFPLMLLRVLMVRRSWRMVMMLMVIP